MGILSRTSLIRRIMIGEMLLSPEIKADTIRCLSDSQAAKSIFKRHFEDLSKKLASDPRNLRERRSLIKDYIKDHFVNQSSEAIEKHVKGLLKKEEKFSEFEENIFSPIFIDWVDPNNLKPANYDLALGKDVYVTTDKVPKKLDAMGKDDVVSIEPGEFGILMTSEYIFVPPDLMGFISVRLTQKQKGLVNISGFHVDPGFYGCLMFAVFNAGPNDVPLRYKEPVFMIMFDKLTGDGSVVKSMQESKWLGMETIPVDTLSGLRGTSVSVRNLDERIKRLEMAFPVVVGGIVSVVIAVITWLLTHW